MCNLDLSGGSRPQQISSRNPCISSRKQLPNDGPGKCCVAGSGKSPRLPLAVLHPRQNGGIVLCEGNWEKCWVVIGNVIRQHAVVGAQEVVNGSGDLGAIVGDPALRQ